MKLNNPSSDRRHGIMFGLAYGDALGAPTEFMKTPDLAKLGSPFQKRVGLNRPQQGIVTDDTQMSIAVAKASITPGPARPGTQTDRFVQEFIAWDSDPKSHDGKRAPGVTCTGAVRALKSNSAQWFLATRLDSKGNGANMRVAPLALRTDWSWAELGGAAQLQAAITHGHPTALAAAELTAVAVRMLLEGIAEPTEHLLDHLLAYAYDQRDRYRGEWLGHLWEAGNLRPAVSPPSAIDYDGLIDSHVDWWDDAAGLAPAVRPAPTVAPEPFRGSRMVKSPAEFIRRGWDEMIDALRAVYAVSRFQQQDPCQVGGEGWVAEQALAVAVHTLICFPGDPTSALRRAAFTNGDSDSIASITGALAGAAYGLKAFPSHWIPNLEYRYELEGLTAQLAAATR